MFKVSCENTFTVGELEVVIIIIIIKIMSKNKSSPPASSGEA
jgi:hypothetical protein